MSRPVVFCYRGGSQKEITYEQEKGTSSLLYEFQIPNWSWLLPAVRIVVSVLYVLPEEIAAMAL